MQESVLPTALAAEAPDEGLLEFLGSVDSEDKGWHEYLAHTDIDRVARRAGNSGNPDGAAAPVRPAAPADGSQPPAGTPPPAAVAKPVAPP